MKNQAWLAAVAIGTKVFWRDPDNGTSSGIYTVSSIESESGKIEDQDTIIGMTNGGSEVQATGGELRSLSLGAMANLANTDLLAFAKRALAALETPDDLSEEEKQHVIEDGGQLIAAIEEAIVDRAAVQVIVNGVNAATAVVDSWESGDLAGAVNVLDGWIDEARETQSPDLDGLVSSLLQTGIDSAQAVVDTWESKHLAGAVSVLEGWLEDTVKDLAGAGLYPVDEPTVVIEVSGGNVSGKSSLGNVRVIVVDYDNGDDNDDVPEIPCVGERGSVDEGCTDEPVFVHRVSALADRL